MNCFYLNTFYSVLTFLYFYTITNFCSHSHHYCYCFVIVIIISSFSMLLTFIFLVFTILFYLCIYWIFLNFKQMTWLNIATLLTVGNKDTETASVSLMGTLNTVYLTYSSDNLLLQWHYYIIVFFNLDLLYICTYTYIYIYIHIIWTRNQCVHVLHSDN